MCSLNAAAQITNFPPKKNFVTKNIFNRRGKNRAKLLMKDLSRYKGFCQFQLPLRFISFLPYSIHPKITPSMDDNLRTPGHSGLMDDNLRTPGHSG